MRRAGGDDAGALALVAAATFLDTFAGILDGPDIVAHCARTSSVGAFTAALARSEPIATLAELVKGHAPVGYSLLDVPDLPVPSQEGDVELKKIYTLSRYHGAGVGPALMARALQDASAAGAKRMLIGVYGGNARARAFYERHGFVLAGTRRFLVGQTHHDDVIYARYL